MVSLGSLVTCDVIITAADVTITAHFLVSSPLYLILLDPNRRGCFPKCHPIPRRLSTNACDVSTACSFNSALFTGTTRDEDTVFVLYCGATELGWKECVAICLQLTGSGLDGTSFTSFN